MARRKDQANGEKTLGTVPPEFAEHFAGVPDDALRERLLGWMEKQYGSSRAYLYWLVKLAASADRETVQLDAVRDLVRMFHGEAPHEVIVTAKREVQAIAGAPELTPNGRATAILRLLGTVGGLPHAARAIGTGVPVDAEVEQVSGTDPHPPRPR